jgi:hypothetical protein
MPEVQVQGWAKVKQCTTACITQDAKNSGAIVENNTDIVAEGNRPPFNNPQ